jgi:fatty acid desaturase
MKSNLEDISFDLVFSPSGLSYKAFRNTLQPRFAIVWRDILLGYVFLLLPFATSLVIPNMHKAWWLAPLLMVYFGYTLAYLHLFVHEAAHFNIHPDKKKNDRLANWLICPLFALDVKNYRKIHWQHHLHLASPNDAEVSYFNVLSASFLLKVITGLHTLHILRTRKKTLANDTHIAQPRVTSVLRFVVMQAVFGLAAWFCGQWLLLISWCAAVGILFPFFATIRQLLEHRDELAAGATTYYQHTRSRISRLFGNGFFSRTFGAAGFNRHLLHHWDPQISYTRYNELYHFLLEAPATQGIVKDAQTSYVRTVLKLFRLS